MTKFEQLKTILHGKLDVYENFDYSKYPNTIAPGSMPANELLQYVVKTHNPSVIIEVGSYLGWSAMGMAKQLKQSNIDGAIVCVDAWMGGEESFEAIINLEGPIKRVNGYPTFYYNFLANMCHNNVNDVVIPFAYPSTVAAQILKKVFLKNNIIVDMAYIDGSHLAQDVFNDCQNFYYLLKPNGVLFGDDWQSNDVRYGILEFCKSENITPPQVFQDGVHWILTKK